MPYNRFLYNTALYNAGREEVGAIAKSIIQAHTGPHIQAVVGGTSGVTFISDFNIIQGIIKPPPSSYRFPDLSAYLKAVFPGTKNLLATIHGFAFFDLPAAIYPSDRIPDLPAAVFSLLQKDLGAIIEGALAIADLPAFLNVPVAALPAVITSFYAPRLFAEIRIESPGNLGARIHTPLDLLAFLGAVNASDLGAIMDILSTGDLPGIMFGNSPGDILAYIKSLISDTADLPAAVVYSTDPNLSATIFPVPNDLLGIIFPKSFLSLGATINFPVPGIPFDLQGIINMIGTKSLIGTIVGFASGERDKFLPSRIGVVGNQPNLAAIISVVGGLRDLGALLISTSDAANLGARLVVAETFVTAILTISTLASRSLRATIGNPACAGGSANYNLLAFAQAQFKGDLQARIESFIERDLGATINSPDIFYAMDTVNVAFTPFKFRFNPFFKATDTIPISFVPFYGDDMGAFIFGELANANLSAELTAVFLQPRVTPNLNRITAADLRSGQDLNIKEVRLTMEGTFLEYFYVNGTDQAFIRDAYENWVINIAAFQEIAEDLFGDFASSRVCRLGDVSSFATLDEAVRSCIDSVLGFSQQGNIGAEINGTGQYDVLSASLNVLAYGVNIGDFNANINQVYDDDFSATITGSL
jgi:hypothetical protein